MHAQLMKTIDDPTDQLRIALCHAFIALAEGEGYLRGVGASAPVQELPNITRICGKWAAARQEITAALSARSSLPVVASPDTSAFENAA